MFPELERGERGVAWGCGGWHTIVNRPVCVVFFSRIKLFLDVLMKEVLHPESQSPNGVKFHFIDIYLDELSKVGGKEVRNNQTSASNVARPQLPEQSFALQSVL